jgi:hypothetical protein
MNREAKRKNNRITSAQEIFHKAKFALQNMILCKVDGVEEI